MSRDVDMVYNRMTGDLDFVYGPELKTGNHRFGNHLEEETYSAGSLRRI
jgi:hypothetical protein